MLAEIESAVLKSLPFLFTGEWGQGEGEVSMSLPQSEIHIHHHHHWDHEVPPWVVATERKLDLVLKTQEAIMTALTDLQAAAAAEDTEIASVITFLTGLPAAVAAAIAAAGTDPVALAAISADLSIQTTNLATALAGAAAALTPPPTPPASAKKP